MKIHDLKCWPANFTYAKAGVKTVELRNNDRNYRVGEILKLRKWDATEGYDESEPPLYREITHVNLGAAHGLAVGYAALSVKPCDAPIEPLGVVGVGRDNSNEQTLLVALSRSPSDDEMRSIHHWLREWRLP